MKRIAAPRLVRMARKQSRYIFEPMPGPHAKHASVPLGYVVRDILGWAASSKEAKALLKSRHVLVDGKPRKEAGFPVGLMNVLSAGNEHYRILLRKHGLHLVAVSPEQAKKKLLKVLEKCSVKGGKMQLHCHDGRNMLSDDENIKPGDVIILDLASGRIEEVLKLRKGSVAILAEGKSRGLVGRIEDIKNSKSMLQPNKVVLSFGSEKKETLRDYVFVLGNDKPHECVGSLEGTKR